MKNIIIEIDTMSKNAKRAPTKKADLNTSFFLKHVLCIEKGNDKKKMFLSVIIILTINVSAQTPYLDRQQDPKYKKHSLLKNNNTSSATTLTCLYDSSKYYTWNTSGSSWLITEKAISTYTNNQIAVQVDKTWKVSSSIWINSGKATYSYSGSNLITEVEQTWDTLHNFWVNAGLWTHSYSGGNLIGLLYQTWDTSSVLWVNSEQWIYTYSGSNLITTLSQTWNAGIWTDYQLDTFSYSGINKTQELYQNWDATFSTWMNSENWIYSYSGSNVTSELYQTWNSSAWANVYLYNFTYNANNITDSMLAQYWNGSSWNNEYRSNSSFCTNNICYSGYIEQNWNTGNNSWLNYTKRDYYGCATANDIAEVKGINTEIIIYPNPAEENLNVVSTTEIGFISVYNAMGEIVLQMRSKNTQEQIDLSNLPNGMYFASITSDKKNATQKFVVSK